MFLFGTSKMSNDCVEHIVRLVEEMNAREKQARRAAAKQRSSMMLIHTHVMYDDDGHMDFCDHLLLGMTYDAKDRPWL